MSSTQSYTLDQLAMIASEQSGLPQAFTKALIQEEGTWNKGSGNPFDVTQEWANLTNFGSYVTGLWNSVGVGIFSDPVAAIQSWAAGLSTFSNYAKFRQDAAGGASAYTLAKDLQDAGYAGNSTTFADNVAKLYQENSGQSGYNPLGPSVPPASVPATTVTTPAPTTTPAPAPKQSPWSTFQIPSVDALNPFQGVATSVTNIGNAIAGVGGVAAKALADVERLFWIIIGTLFILAGIYVIVSGEKDATLE